MLFPQSILEGATPSSDCQHVRPSLQQSGGDRLADATAGSRYESDVIGKTLQRPRVQLSTPVPGAAAR